MPPALLQLPTETDYRTYFVARYCNAPRLTRDGIPVHFRDGNFDHAFFESANRKQADKSLFSVQRAERIAWIGAALLDPSSELFVGWHQKQGRHDPARRVTLVYLDYVVVVRLVEPKACGHFITAFTAEQGTLIKIRSSPRWLGKWKP